jgi:YjbE family integral membrane protein
MLAEIFTQKFWIGFVQIVGIDIILSGDNAVVIALAARSLPPRQQRRAIIWGTVGAVTMRVLFAVVAMEALKLPYLKLVGAGLLLWIGAKLLLPDSGGGGGGEESHSSANMFAAIRTILIADGVMSLDNVIAVAAAAKESVLLLGFGLALSIPLVVFGSTYLLKWMGRFPIIITLGGALLGWVAGDMVITDPLIKTWVETTARWLHVAAPLAGAVVVVLIGKWWAARLLAQRPLVDLASNDRGPPAPRVD